MAKSNTATTDAPVPEPEEAKPPVAGQDSAESAHQRQGGSSTKDTPTVADGQERAAPSAPETAEEPVDPVTALENEVAHWKDLALRARADLDNFRKRMSAEKSECIRFANRALFESLLPVLDNFHFGLEAARTATEPSGVVMGMGMVLKQFEDFLQNHNIYAVNADPGMPFDPNQHEAVAQEHDAEVAEGSILKVVRRGYRMGERLVRASNVIVSKGPENP